MALHYANRVTKTNTERGVAIIYRDDDIGKYTDLTTIMNIHELFLEHDKIHTVTILTDELWSSRGVWEWLTTTPNLDIALHGSCHWDYSGLDYESILTDLGICLDDWKKHNSRMGVDIPIDTFYPPWNKVCPDLFRACETLGLMVNDSVDEKEVFNFHWWEFIGGRNLEALEERLKNDTT